MITNIRIRELRKRKFQYFIIIIGGGFSDISGLLSAMLHRVFYQTPGIYMVMYCFTLAL